MVGVQPEFFGCGFQQFLFNGQRCFTRGDAGAVGNPEDVSVDGDGRFTKGDIQHDICGFASHPGQFLQRGAIMWHRTFVFVEEELAGGDDVFGFGAIEADTFDVCLQPVDTELE